jgi:hypothetical protein
MVGFFGLCGGAGNLLENRGGGGQQGSGLGAEVGRVRHSVADRLALGCGQR